MPKGQTSSAYFRAMASPINMKLLVSFYKQMFMSDIKTFNRILNGK